MLFTNILRPFKMKFLFVVLFATFLATAALAQITCNLNQKLRSSVDPEIEKDICFDGICRLLGECRLPKKCLHEVQPGFCDCGYVCAKKFGEF